MSDMYLKRAGANTVLKKPIEKRTAISKLLTPEQMDLFNQLAGKESGSIK